MTDPIADTLRITLADVATFAEVANGINLRTYQREIASAIVESVWQKQGFTFVIILPRQSGKNELQAQIESFLLITMQMIDAEIVKVQPTWKPQALNAMRRLERVLRKNVIVQNVCGLAKESGYIFKVGKARAFFLSGDPAASIVGATASTLLEVDEAQDVLIPKYDKDIAPMGASTNVTRVFWGTAWTSQTLLAREKRNALAAQAADGIRRVWQLTADDIAQEVRAYGQFVRSEIAKLGRNHPMVRTQYFSEEIDAEGGMFPPSRLEAIKGHHAPLERPAEGELYALLIDVAGADEGASLDPGAIENQKRDSTALTMLRVDATTASDPAIGKPSYQVVNRWEWIGVKQTALYAKIRAIIDEWQPCHVVIDATGIGAGLTSFLAQAYPLLLTPFIFNSKTKSDLGWAFLAIIDTGRLQEYQVSGDYIDYARYEGENLLRLHSRMLRQMEFCQYEVIPGPGQQLRWSVPSAARDPLSGDLMHDDLLLSLALCAELDSLDWSSSSETLIIQAHDPLTSIDAGGF